MKRLSLFLNLDNNRNKIILLLFMSIALLWGGITLSVFNEADDPYHAALGREIIEKKSIFSITNPWGEHRSQLFFAKSTYIPLLVAFGQKTFGYTVMGAKFFLLLHHFICLILIFFVLYRNKNSEFAFISIMIILSTQLVLSYSRRVGFDAAVTFEIAVSVLYFFFAKKRRSYLFLAGVFAGLACMSKGVTGLWAPFLIFINILSSKKHREGFIHNFIYLAISFLLVTLPWHLMMYWIHSRSFIEEYFIKTQLSYFVADPNGEENKWPYWSNVKKLVENYWPWLITLILSLLYFAKRVFKKDIFSFDYIFVRFLIIWFFSIFIFYQFSDFKRYYLTLPAYIPAGLLSAEYIVSRKLYPLWRRIIVIFLLLLSVLFLFTPAPIFLDALKSRVMKYKGVFEYLHSTDPAVNTLWQYRPDRKSKQAGLYDNWFYNQVESLTPYRKIKTIFHANEIELYLKNESSELLIISTLYETNLSTYFKNNANILYSDKFLILYKM